MSGKMGPGDSFWRCSSRVRKRQSVATKPLGELVTGPMIVEGMERWKSLTPLNAQLERRQPCGRLVARGCQGGLF
jgi:hypothetical protein